MCRDEAWAEIDEKARETIAEEANKKRLPDIAASCCKASSFMEEEEEEEDDDDIGMMPLLALLYLDLVAGHGKKQGEAMEAWWLDREWAPRTIVVVITTTTCFLLLHHLHNYEVGFLSLLS